MATNRILVLCTGNSCRSQMAEGFINHELGDHVEAVSAGSNPSGYVHPKAIEVMGELDIDISKGVSKHLEQFLDQSFDVVVTVCDSAKESCPVFPGAVNTMHHSFTDPAEATGTEEEILTEFRRVRDEIRAWVAEEFGG